MSDVSVAGLDVVDFYALLNKCAKTARPRPAAQLFGSAAMKVIDYGHGHLYTREFSNLFCTSYTPSLLLLL